MIVILWCYLIYDNRQNLCHLCALNYNSKMSIINKDIENKYNEFPIVCCSSDSEVKYSRNVLLLIMVVSSLPQVSSTGGCGYGCPLHILCRHLE